MSDKICPIVELEEDVYIYTICEPEFRQGRKHANLSDPEQGIHRPVLMHNQFH